MTVDWLSSFCSGAKVLIYSESFNLVQFSECLGCRLLTNYNFSKVTLNTIPVIIIILLGFRSVHNKKQQPRLASPWLKSLSCVGTELAATTNTEHTLQPAWAGTAFTISIGVPVPMKAGGGRYVKKTSRKYNFSLIKNNLRHYFYFLPARVSNILKF